MLLSSVMGFRSFLVGWQLTLSSSLTAAVRDGQRLWRGGFGPYRGGADSPLFPKIIHVANNGRVAAFDAYLQMRALRDCSVRPFPTLPVPRERSTFFAFSSRLSLTGGPRVRIRLPPTRRVYCEPDFRGRIPSRQSVFRMPSRLRGCATSLLFIRSVNYLTPPGLRHRLADGLFPGEGDEEAEAPWLSREVPFSPRNRANPLPGKKERHRRIGPIVAGSISGSNSCHLGAGVIHSAA